MTAGRWARCRPFIVTGFALAALCCLQGLALAGGEAAAQAAETAGREDFGKYLLQIALVLGAAAVVPIVVLVATALRGPQGEPEEELEPVTAGIGYGGGRVPRWLYAAYALIPLFALFYVAQNASVKHEATPTPRPAAGGAEEPKKDAGAGDAGAPAGPVKISAKNIQFDKKQLTIPASGTVTVEFRNADSGVPHNVAFYKSRGGEAIFKGPVFNGVAIKTMTFPSPGAGTYWFQCDVHPSMNGTATAK